MRERERERERESSRLIYISVLNILACIGVIMLHTNGIFWSHPSGRLWITSNLIETLMYWPVPIFFMICGVTLLDYREKYSTRVYFHKRVTKTVIPFICWSIIAFICHAGLAYWHGKEFDTNIMNIIINILNTKYMNIYWFFIPLFAIYLSIPFISLIENKMRIFGYMIGYTLISYSILPLLSNLFHFSLNKALQSPVSSGYILYILLGYYIENSTFTKKVRLTIYFFAILGWLMHFLGTLILTEPTGTINTTFKGYLNIPCVMYSVGIFVFIKYIDFSSLKNNMFLTKLINILSSLTFGIYLLHMFFVHSLPKIFSFNTGNIYWRTLGAAGIFIVCGGLVYIMKRVPYIRKIVP